MDVIVHEPILSVKFKFIDGRVVERDIRLDEFNEILA
jgi:hypothetical protein